MQLIGLAGRAGSGKDTVADYLVDRYGFVKFSFSDTLYAEVQKAFGLDTQDLLRSRESKEQRTGRLSLKLCRDRAFVEMAVGDAIYDDLVPKGEHPEDVPLSPRWILQKWGTEYRRAQDPDYWLKQADLFIKAFLSVVDPGETGGLVNTSVRFENEADFIHDQSGSVWHIHRASLPTMDNSGHVSEKPVEFVFGIDKEVHNNSTIEKLHTGISLLYASGAPRIIIEDDTIDVVRTERGNRERIA